MAPEIDADNQLANINADNFALAPETDTTRVDAAKRRTEMKALRRIAAAFEDLESIDRRAVSAALNYINDRYRHRG